MTRSVWLPVIVAFVIFVLAWKAIVVLTGLPPFILPAPETVGQRFVEAWLDGLGGCCENALKRRWRVWPSGTSVSGSR